MKSGDTDSSKPWTDATETRLYVWDVFIRLFHWLLVIAVTTSFIAVQFDAMTLHITSGLFICGLLIFRILWGIAGSSTAQFHNFIRGPAAVLNYVRSEVLATKTGVDQAPVQPLPHSQHAGHSPLGALSVVAILAALIAQVSTGLFADDEIFNTGPLARFVGIDFSSNATALHGMNAKVIFLLIIVHLAAIVFYHAVKRVNLIGPMVSGWKQLTVRQINDYETVKIRQAGVAIIAILFAGSLTGVLFYL